MENKFLYKSKIFHELLIKLTIGSVLTRSQAMDRMEIKSVRAFEYFKSKFEEAREVKVDYFKSFGGYKYSKEVYNNSFKLSELELYSFNVTFEELSKISAPDSFKKLFPRFAQVMHNLPVGINWEVLEKVMQFDNDYELIGIENLEKLVELTSTKATITFKYFNYTTQKESIIMATPFLLREYDKRWYLIAFLKDSTAPKIYGLDRISDIKKSKIKFKAPKKFDYQIFNKYSFGITHSSEDEPKQKVILSFDKIQKGYLGNRPAHFSQEEVDLPQKKYSDRFNISLNVHWENSPEIKQFIRKYGDEVIVVEPVGLRKLIK